MSFTKLDKNELIEVAEIFGVDVDKRWGDKNIIAAILDEGVTWDMYEDAKNSVSEELLESNLPEPEEAPVVEAPKKFSKKAMELLKMERRNPTFSVLGYKFTTEHPFVLMSPADALWIMAHEEGFRVATPEEAEAFYK